MGAVGTAKNSSTSGLVTALKNMKATEESNSAQNNETYVDGNTTYWITKEGNSYYLNSDYQGSNVQLEDKWKISYADNDDKARVYIPTLKTYMNINSEPQILKLLQNKRNASAGSSSAQNISFADMMKQADNQITFGKIVTISPKGYIPESGKKGDLGKLVDKYNINSVVVNMYRDKSGANDMKRLKELGFEIKSQTLGTQQEGSKIPPKDYYYMVRKKK